MSLLDTVHRKGKEKIAGPLEELCAKTVVQSAIFVLPFVRMSACFFSVSNDNRHLVVSYGWTAA